MAAEHLVAGDGWVSDDSSFYGSVDEQEHQQALCENINLRFLWSTRDKEPNALRMAAKK